MGNISVQVIDEKDYQMMMSVLKEFADKNIIRILEEENDEDSIALPGPPLTDEQWVKYIEKAEAEPSLSEAEMRTIFKYLKITNGKMTV